MSLFQVNEWWKCSRTEPEECGAGCLCVANIDNATDNLDKIILGSYNGILHIYSPSKDSGGLHDCLLETNLQCPILQIIVGRFVPVNSDIHLAVLHPRLLSVYKFTIAVGKQETEMKMQIIYQHKLERLAANMVCGPFGGVRDRDFICVQSLDGALSVFEQETFAFTRFLPGFLLPGPLAYTVHSDSFITASSSNILESYSYQVLAVASDTKTGQNENAVVQGGKRIKADWSFNLGEYAMEIEVINFPEKRPQMVVLGEHSLFCLDTAGKLEFMKKFEDTISCVKSFPSSNGLHLMTIACTHSRQVLVFESATMKWAAKLDDVPVVAQIGQFGGFPGMMVFTTDECQVSCHYLGTSPTMFTLPRSKQREMSHDYVDRELQQTKKLITDHLAVSGDELRGQKIKSDLKVSLQIPKSLDKTSVANQGGGVLGTELPSFTMQINLKVTRRINEVQVSIPVHKPLCSTLSNICYPMLLDQDPPLIRVSFFLEERLPPSTLDHKVLVYYQQISAIPQVVSLDFRLPLSLVAHPSPPIKKLEHRLTLDTNKACVNLMELFPAFATEHCGPTCVGFSYMNGVKGTILTSKSSNRYRIQCEEFYGLWLLTDELIRCLRSRHSDIYITSQDPPSLEDFVLLIDEHFKLRKAGIEMRGLLQQRTHQYRSIQRRLLTRFKDKTPQPLNGLDTLLLGTHTQIIALADAIEDNEALLRQCCVKLSSATRLIALLPSLWRPLSTEDIAQLESTLAADMTYNESNSVGWEEIVDTSLTALLKTTLSRNDGGASSFSAAVDALEIPQDTVKLKKHLAIVMDKLCKGGKLIGRKQSLSTEAESRLSEFSQDVADGYDDQHFTSTSSAKRSSLSPESQTTKVSKQLPTAPSLSENAEDLLNGDDLNKSIQLTRNKNDKYEMETYFDDEDYSDILS